MMKAAKGLLRANWLPKRVVLYNLTRLFQVRGMMLTREVRPGCAASSRELRRLFDEALPETAALIEGYDGLLFTGRPLPARFRRNYETLRRFPPAGKKPAPKGEGRE